MRGVTAPLQRLDALLRPRGHVFYGWWIVLAGIGVQMMGSALMMQSYGAYVVLRNARAFATS